MQLRNTEKNIDDVTKIGMNMIIEKSNYIKLAIGANKHRGERAFFVRTDTDLIVQVKIQENSKIQTQIFVNNEIPPGWELTQYYNLGINITINSFRQLFDFKLFYEIRAMKKILHLLFNKSLINQILQEWKGISWNEKIWLIICTIVDTAADIRTFFDNMISQNDKDKDSFFDKVVKFIKKIFGNN